MYDPIIKLRTTALDAAGLVQVQATLTKDQSLDAARDAVYKAVEDVIANPPTREELERVRTQALRGLENNLSNAQSIATGALNTAIAQGDWRLMFLQHDLLEKVQPADLVRVAKDYFKASNRTVGYYIPDMSPDRTVVPSRPDLDRTLNIRCRSAQWNSARSAFAMSSRVFF